MKNELESLWKKAHAAQIRYRDALWKYERETAYPKALKLVGSVWMMRNCYSCPGSAADYWTLYFRIASVSTKGIRFHQIQIDKNGKLEIERNLHAPFERFIGGRYERASLHDWKRELGKVERIIQELAPEASDE